MAAELLGVKELIAKLDKLGFKKKGQVLRKAANQAVKPVVEKARGNLAAVVKHEPLRLHKTYKGRLVAPGFSQRNVAAKTHISRDKSSVSASVGVRREAFYAINFVELTTSRRVGTPWLVPAFEGAQSNMLSTVASVLRKEIERTARVK